MLNTPESSIDSVVSEIDDDIANRVSDLSFMELVYKKLELYYRIKLMHKTLKEQIFKEDK